MWEAEDTQREKGRTGWGSEAEESERETKRKEKKVGHMSNLVNTPYTPTK